MRSNFNAYQLGLTKIGIINTLIRLYLSIFSTDQHVNTQKDSRQTIPLLLCSLWNLRLCANWTAMYQCLVKPAGNLPYNAKF